MQYKFIDKIVSIEPDTITAVKCFTVNEDIFRDHFPGNPIAPAAMLIEAGVELARYFYWSSSNFSQTCLLQEVKKIKFYRTVGPGSKIVITNKFSRAAVNIFSCVCFNDREEKVFEGMFSVFVTEFISLHDEKQATDDLDVLCGSTHG